MAACNGWPLIGRLTCPPDDASSSTGSTSRSDAQRTASWGVVRHWVLAVKLAVRHDFTGPIALRLIAHSLDGPNAEVLLLLVALPVVD